VASVESHRTRALLEFCCQVKFILVTLLDAYAMVRPLRNTKKSLRWIDFFSRFLTFFKSIWWPWSVGLGVISTHSDGSFKIPSRPKQHYLKRTDSTIHSSCCCDRNQPRLSVYLLSQLKGWGSLDHSSLYSTCFPADWIGKNLSKAVTKFHKFTKIHSLACSLGQQRLLPRWHPCRDLWWEVLIKRSLTKHFHGFHMDHY